MLEGSNQLPSSAPSRVSFISFRGFLKKVAKLSFVTELVDGVYFVILFSCNRVTRTMDYTMSEKRRKRIREIKWESKLT